jgi:hypothetical protein
MAGGLLVVQARAQSEKMTKIRVEYQGTPNGIYSCATCTLFVAPQCLQGGKAKSARTAGARPTRWLS